METGKDLDAIEMKICTREKCTDAAKPIDIKKTFSNGSEISGLLIKVRDIVTKGRNKSDLEDYMDQYNDDTDELTLCSNAADDIEDLLTVLAPLIQKSIEIVDEIEGCTTDLDLDPED